MPRTYPPRRVYRPVRIDPADDAALAQMAEDTGRNKADLIRQGVHAMLVRNGYRGHPRITKA